ncbi:MAG: hypothetical protein Q7K33_04575 [Candidatus Berkelbacteria bacterium]|nr:hypothetical protein [Candidatus Berkelbacteria bacterium]
MAKGDDNNDWAWRATAITLGIGLIVALGFLIFQAIKEFYQAHTVWFWLIISVIVLIIISICYLARYRRI